MKYFSPILIIAVVVTMIFGVEFLYSQRAYAATDVFTASGTWTAPAGVTSVNVDAWGGGAGGLTSGATGGAGGGGGAYSGLNAFSVTPGNNYTVTVGSGGATGFAGATSTFSASSTLLAAQGNIGISSNQNGGVGGKASDSVGNTTHSGGNGGSGGGNVSGGGGGGGGGTTADGGAGTNSGVCGSSSAGGIGGATGGGNGGKGAGSTNSVAGSVPGGGGGGGSFTCNFTNAQAGARGEVDITYTFPTAVPVTFSHTQGARITTGGKIIIK